MSSSPLPSSPTRAIEAASAQWAKARRHAENLDQLLKRASANKLESMEDSLAEMNDILQGIKEPQQRVTRTVKKLVSNVSAQTKACIHCDMSP